MHALLALLGIASAKYVKGLGKLKKTAESTSTNDEETNDTSTASPEIAIRLEEPVTEIDEPAIASDEPEVIAEEVVVGEPTGGATDEPRVPIDIVAAGTMGVFGHGIDDPIVLEFSDTIQLGEGFIELCVFDGKSYVTVEMFDVSALGTETNGPLSVAGSSLSITPSSDLDLLREYSIRIDSGAIVGTNGASFDGVESDSTISFTTGIDVDLPSVDPADYDNIIYGQTFNSTVYVDEGDSNTLFINCVFENIDGNGMMIRDVSNVTIYNCTFQNIADEGILLRSTGSTESVSIMSNTFDDIGGDGIHATKRFADDVDHTNLLIYDNQINDTGLKGGSVYHGIYVQSSESVIWGNEVTGQVDANGISIRGDGIVWDNYVNVESGRFYGSGIKYFSDHETGDSKTLIIADNEIAGTDLYSGIQLDLAADRIPSGIESGDWVVNDFQVYRNTVDGATHDYLFEDELVDADWSNIDWYLDSSPEDLTAALTLQTESVYDESVPEEEIQGGELELLF